MFKQIPRLLLVFSFIFLLLLLSSCVTPSPANDGATNEVADTTLPDDPAQGKPLTLKIGMAGRNFDKACILSGPGPG